MKSSKNHFKKGLKFESSNTPVNIICISIVECSKENFHKKIYDSSPKDLKKMFTIRSLISYLLL